jgi:hypothetical protein
MNTIKLTLVGCFLAVTGAALAQSTDLRLTHAEGELRATLPDGALYWTYRFGDGAPPGSVRPVGQYIELADGAVLSADGQMLRRRPALLQNNVGTMDATGSRAAAWDSPVLLVSPPAGHALRHFFDAAGNAWVIVPVTTSSCLKVRQSIGHTGSWGSTVTVPVGTSDIFSPQIAVDLSDRITVVFRSGYYGLRYVRYTPGTGWGPCQQFYSTGTFFQVIEMGTDAPGNVAVIFDAGAARCIVYNAASGVWEAAYQVSPSGYSIMLPTVLHNAAVDVMYLVYRVVSGGPVGLYAHRWNSATRTWGPAEFLPGTSGASFCGAGPGSRFPSVVGYDGEATVFWVDSAHHPHASRTAGGIWQTAVELVPYEAEGLEDFASAAANRLGDAAGIVSCWGSGLNRLYVFRYQPGVGWLAPENPHTTTFNKFTRVRIGYYQGRRAVATMIDLQGGIEQLVSFLFDGITWAPGILDIPGNESAYFSELTPDRGEVLLVYEGSVNEVSQGVKATFLRDAHSGDVNCDGAIDFGDINPFVLALTDPSQYQQTYPDCDFMNADINEDGSLDFGDINPFVALLTGS